MSRLRLVLVVIALPLAAQTPDPPAPPQAARDSVAGTLGRILADRIDRRRLSLAHRCRRQLRHLPQHRKPRLGTEAARRGLHPHRSQSSRLRSDPRARQRLGRRALPDLPSRRQEIQALRFQRRLSRHRVFQFSSVVRRSAAGAGNRAQRTILRYAPPSGQLPARSAAGQLVHPLFRLRSGFRLRPRRDHLRHRLQRIPGPQHSARSDQSLPRRRSFRAAPFSRHTRARRNDVQG